MLRIFAVIGVAILMVAAVSSAQAAYAFELTQQDPDIEASNLAVTYTTSNGLLKVKGNASTLTPLGGTQAFITGGTYELDATMNPVSGGALQSGTLTVDGTYVSQGYNFTSGVLLTANLTAISYQDYSNVIYFKFTPTSGDAAPIFGNAGAIILTMSQVPLQNNLWAAGFQSTGIALSEADSFSTTPEPGTFAALALGLLSCAAIRRRRSA